ncbi:MAG TPA: hypothetical protein PK052_12360 [Anaerohalosphaeraceae bacterium]|nr:hypothetical protein [Phycisphaerae bacterium]HOK96600.1 hypothetical protein [Anaerohalosphaeraceae bacterium]HOL32761.1 hypothetical protein [Anaerohalosphaeraceae bacterium]HOM76129.1 hypothetical protein [Anaerohalosphaeraceae bacterium]HPC63749.1 hypothetical protein [Anaerohalosphaeraceae bacterium]
MKKWLFIASVILTASFVLADDQPSRPSPDSPRPQRQEVLRPAAAERLGAVQRQQQERLDRLEQQLNHLIKRLESQAEPIPGPKAVVPPVKAIKPQRGPRGHRPFWCAMMVCCAVVHILSAVWVFQDIRTRGAGSGVWIVIALLAGLFGVLVYAVVRLGDIRKT